jgi:hypothetical protein
MRRDLVRGYKPGRLSDPASNPMNFETRSGLAPFRSFGDPTLSGDGTGPGTTAVSDWEDIAVIFACNEWPTTQPCVCAFADHDPECWLCRKVDGRVVSVVLAIRWDTSSDSSFGEWPVSWLRTCHRAGGGRSPEVAGMQAIWLHRQCICGAELYPPRIHIDRKLGPRGIWKLLDDAFQRRGRVIRSRVA